MNEDIINEYDIEQFMDCQTDYTEMLIVIQENQEEMIDNINNLVEVEKNMMIINTILMFVIVGLIVAISFIKGLFE